MLVQEWRRVVWEDTTWMSSIRQKPICASTDTSAAWQAAWVATERKAAAEYEEIQHRDRAGLGTGTMKHTVGSRSFVEHSEMMVAMKGRVNEISQPSSSLSRWQELIRTEMNRSDFDVVGGVRIGKVRGLGMQEASGIFPVATSPRPRGSMDAGTFIAPKKEGLAAVGEQKRVAREEFKDLRARISLLEDQVRMVVSNIANRNSRPPSSRAPLFKPPPSKNLSYVCGTHGVDHDKNDKKIRDADDPFI